MPPAAAPSRLCPRCGVMYDARKGERFCSADGAALIPAIATTSGQVRHALSEVETAQKMRLGKPASSPGPRRHYSLHDADNTVPVLRVDGETVPVPRHDAETMPVERAEATAPVTRAEPPTAQLGRTRNPQAEVLRARLREQWLEAQQGWLRLSAAMLAAPCPDPAALSQERARLH